MLHLSSLAGLFSEEHSIGISDWSCGNVDEPVESCNAGIGPDLIGFVLINGLMIFQDDS